VEQNYALAGEWYRRAAHHAPNLGGAGQARNRLGRLFLKGKRVNKNYVQAYLWLYVGGVMDLTEVTAQMTPAQEAGKIPCAIRRANYDDLGRLNLKAANV
jgi:hypothetical protein